jgi:FtsP/CotA-like multicopper oxidase with cupredoxin domain
VYHSHQGLQVDRGLFGSLVIEESTPHIQWDREYTVILDDFLPSEPRLSGVGTRGPMGGMRRGMGGMGRSGGMGMMGIETPPYTGFLVNGRLPSGAPVFEVSRGDRARLRLINPSGTTTFRVTIAGHQMMVSHTDGRPIRPVFVDSLIIGTGERYDVIVNANNPGVWALIATPLEVNAEPARAVIRYKEVRASNTEAQLPDRRGRDLRLDDLISVESAGSGKTVDRTMDFVLSGGMMSSAWTMNGQAYPAADPLSVRQGERVRVRLTNHSMMIHPMHLHGHFFRVGQAVKDTVIVPPFMGRVDFDFLADNPGNWFFHCHNVYHMVSGMARVVRYVV